jgi:nucleoside-diphosphate-sugar epimerase
MGKNALIIGGCGRRGKLSATKLIKDGYFVVLLDNLISGSDPKEWDCWDSQNLVFYCEDAVKFLTDPDHIFINTQWDIVMQFAKIKSVDVIEETTTNNIIDGYFFKWWSGLAYNKPQLISPMYSLVAQELMRHIESS